MVNYVLLCAAVRTERFMSSTYNTTPGDAAGIANGPKQQGDLLLRAIRPRERELWVEQKVTGFSFKRSKRHSGRGIQPAGDGGAAVHI